MIFWMKIFLITRLKVILIVAGIILFVLILKRVISRYFAGLIYRLVKIVWKDVDKKSFFRPGR